MESVAEIGTDVQGDLQFLHEVLGSASRREFD